MRLVGSAEMREIDRTAIEVFGIPALTSRSPFVAGSNAFGSGRRLKSDRVFGTIDRFLDLHETPLEIAALISLAVAALRRDLVTLALGAGAAIWVVIEVGFSLHGWPGLGRYMFPAAGVMVVVAAVLAGRILTDLPAFVSDWLPPDQQQVYFATRVQLEGFAGDS